MICLCLYQFGFMVGHTSLGDGAFCVRVNVLAMVEQCSEWYLRIVGCIDLATIPGLVSYFHILVSYYLHIDP